MEPSRDVVVIGAGLAGLLCARTLQERGFDVDVIDAADGIGGRVRTDVIDGFRCDRGFQLLNPAYPAARRYLDLKALRLGTFRAGVAVADGSRLRILADPRRAPGLLPATIRSGYLNPAELARLVRWAAPALGRVSRLLADGDHTDTTLAASLDAARVTGRLRHQVLMPFLSGVLADAAGADSAALVRLFLRSFLLGTPGVPAGGMTAMPLQLAEGLSGPVRLRVLAHAVACSDGGVTVGTDDGELRARAVVVAADPVAAGYLTGQPAPAMKGLTTFWFAADALPELPRLLVVDSGGPAAGPIVNAAVMSAAAPSYAPPGRHLVQASTLLSAGWRAGEADVRRQLTRMLGTSTAGWELVIRHDVPHALPAQPPPLRHRQPVDLGDGLFVAGDHRDTGSIQGALVSGRRAANAVTARLRS